MKGQCLKDVEDRHVTPYDIMYCWQSSPAKIMKADRYKHRVMFDGSSPSRSLVLHARGALYAAL